MTQWICPCCEGENLEYGAIELEWDQCYFPRRCVDCRAEWEEWYSMDFIEHTITKEWKTKEED